MIQEFAISMGACPVCKSVHTFLDSRSSVAVCSVCNSVFERSDEDSLNKALVLHAHRKPASGVIHAGAKGRLTGKDFTVTGGLYLELDGWNERIWWLHFSDQSGSWLLETTDGFYLLTRLPLLKAESLKLIKSVMPGTETFSIEQQKGLMLYLKSACQLVGLEGEVALPDFNAATRMYRLINSMDAEVMLWEFKSGGFLFSMEPIDEAHLQWEASSGNSSEKEASAISCKNCGRSLTVETPLTRYLACGACFQLHERKEISIESLGPLETPKFVCAIPLYSTGTIHGLEYRLVGACEKSETGNKQFRWREYTLYREGSGYCWLSEYNGHWMLVQSVAAGVVFPDYKQEIDLFGRKYLLYNEYQCRLESAIGEFADNPKERRTRIREYIHPPNMFIAALDPGTELLWQKATALSKTEVAAGFGKTADQLPHKEGVGAIELGKWHADLPVLARAAVVAILILFGIQFIYSLNHRQQIVLRDTYYARPDSAAQAIVTPSFQLDKASANLQFTLHAPVSNTWFEAAFTLVNDQTGKELNFEKGVEYYYGTSGGENWTEGAQDEEVTLSAVPKGTYHLIIFPSYDISMQDRYFQLEVMYDVPMWRNFIILALIAALYPALLWLINQGFEQRRWFENDYSPYKTSNDDED